MSAPRLVRWSCVCGVTLLALVAPVVARGAGLEVPDNGAYILARGGTAAALTGTAYSLQFNPAGLTDIASWDIRLDMRLVGNGVTFTRAPTMSNGTLPTGLNFQQVSNGAGPFLGPSVEIGYHPKKGYLHHFAFGVGVWGPPGVGAYSYPNPQTALNNGDLYGETVGQRYSLVSNSNLILFPSLGVAYSPVKQFSIGVTLQSAYAQISFSQGVAGESVSDTETLQTEALAKLSVTDPFEFAGIIGATIKPIDGLTIGATFKPKVTLHASGTFDFTPLQAPGAAPARFNQDGNKASLELALPPEARLGVSYERGAFSYALEGDWEGWSAYRNLVVDASGISTSTDGEPFVSVGQQVVAKHWQDTWGGRIGGSWRAIRQTPDNDLGLQVHLGGLFETNAIPAAYQAMDTVTGNRVGFSTGLTLSYGDVAITAAGMYYLPVSLDNTTSTVTRTVADKAFPDNPPDYVARGRYTANVWIAALGLAWTPDTSF